MSLLKSIAGPAAAVPSFVALSSMETGNSGQFGPKF